TSDSLYAFAASNGRVLWRKAFGADGVAAYGDLVFSAEADQSADVLYAFDARSGAARWQVSAPSPGWGFSAPVAEHGVIYAMLFASQQGGYETAFNASDGARLWQSPLLKLNGAFNPPGAPLVVGGSLYLPATDGSLIALDTRTGQPLWTYTPASGASAGNYGGFSPLWSDGQVVYIGEMGHMMILKASDGTVIRRQDILHYQGSAFMVSGSMLFVNSADGVVHALKLADGTQVWHYTYFQPHQETGFDAAAMVLAA
ncbi:MAG TPA: PQQ-binding-like beta-propeller repeat protein, partial [Ktedonobacterales bacterium]